MQGCARERETALEPSRFLHLSDPLRDGRAHRVVKPRHAALDLREQCRFDAVRIAARRRRIGRAGMILDRQLNGARRLFAEARIAGTDELRLYLKSRGDGPLDADLTHPWRRRGAR